jgi:hypothetical protein
VTPASVARSTPSNPPRKAWSRNSNSLAAQHEACEAFIRSQRDEGWVLAKIRYDDRGLAHAPRRLHDEVYVDYNDMIYAALPAEIEQRR